MTVAVLPGALVGGLVVRGAPVAGPSLWRGAARTPWAVGTGRGDGGAGAVHEYGERRRGGQQRHGR
ncbi:hypothetical protein KIH74_28705 [Kineosporia sp. J2-2]|uniref:Uncharacterized protein n=1 Tax=Kineosporia corallincola TaxID=2835133 RepID=A0ABS5TQ56_9ACTN|nr:hypothetical protein [Kineosporia corallincola]MBT0772958.1 hypothetical protein [Kineosporia corallincola]